MHRLILTVIFCSLIVSPLLSLDPPQPIQGTAMIRSKQFSNSAGGLNVVFNLPTGWGMGSIQSASGKGRFTLFPITGGYGCSVQVDSYSQEGALAQAMANLKKTFSQTKNVANGFEVELPKAWYACYQKGLKLVQIWYSLPKKEKSSTASWNALKSCVEIEEDEEEVEVEGCVAIHPTTGQMVILDLWNQAYKANKDSNFLYAATIDDMVSSSKGFFYVKWDQDTDDVLAFEQHLKDMIADVKKIEPTQKVGEAKYFVDQGFAAVGGKPYDFYTIAGQGFLFGFAVKNSMPYRNYDVDRLINKVQCTAPN